jgi:hypothetical protein
MAFGYLTYSQSEEAKQRAGKYLHVQVLQIIREILLIAIPRKDRPAMSNCVEYVLLHQRYARALTSWLRVTSFPEAANDRAAEQERDAAFRALSDHKVDCRRCNSGAG